MYDGLTENEAMQRLSKYGANVLKGKKKTSALKIFISQFKDFMVIILLVCTVISALMGDKIEAIAIISIVIVNALMGFIQEFKTEKTLEALNSLAAPKAKVIRDGEHKIIDAANVVPGDLVVLEQGDLIPADAKILETHGIKVDESLLTGESVPVEKKTKENVFMGTTLRQGHCICEVHATGMKTEMGHIANLLDETESSETPLQRKLAQMGKYIAMGCLVICAVVTVTGIARGEDVLTMLMSGISLAVAAVPEGLPAIVTIALALGVQRMVKRNALARKLPAIETLGCATVICSDKTGTLTENKMEVRKNFVFGNNLNLLYEIALSCNNSTVKDGDPTEVALMKMVQKEAPKLYKNEKSNLRLDEISFDSERKCMSVIVKRNNGEKYIFTKGAPDVILKKCNRYMNDSSVLPLESGKGKYAEILRQNNEMCGEALRVLAFAYRKIDEKEWPEFPRKDFEQKLIFVGLSGMMDPPRKEAAMSVKRCQQAGIRTHMITGDHKVTALAIAKEVNIWSPGDNVMTGEDIDRLSDEEFESKIDNTTVFARVMPKHKIKIVRTLKSKGHIVAMTGDGVNDAPAVKEADIGVAMGKEGTDVTRQAASLVLLDDNFSTIVAAIEEGRVIFSNIRKFLRYLLSCNIGEVLTMFIAMLVGLPMPLLPIQVLWVNLATDGLPAIALGLEPGDKDVMKKRPRRPNESIFSDGLISRIIIRGIMIGLSTLVVYSTIYYMSYDKVRAGTACFATLVFSQLVHVFECKSEEKSVFEIPLFNNLYLVGAVILSTIMMLSAVYLPQLQIIFRTCALNREDWFLVAGFSLLGPVSTGLFMAISRFLKFIFKPILRKLKSK